MEGIRDGNAREALDQYTGDRYTQHSTGVADGKEGFLAFFLPFLERNPVRDITIARALVDGDGVFVHVFQSLNGGEAKWVTADFFDTDAQDKIVEHWDTIQAFVQPTVSGRSMIDGSSTIGDLERTESNRALVSSYLQDVLVARAYHRMGEFIAADQYHEHSPKVPDGLAGVTDYFANAASPSVHYITIHKLLVQGNFAASLSEVRIEGVDHAVIDIFRMAGGQIVEHWDVAEAIAPRDTWNNSGKF